MSKISGLQGRLSILDKSISRSANTDKALNNAPATLACIENTMEVFAGIPAGKRTGVFRKSIKRV